MSKVKTAYDIGRIIGAALLQGRRRRPQPRRVKLRFGGSRTVTNTRRRRRRNNKGNGLEINHAEGGRKDNTQTGAMRTLTVDYYGRIVCLKEQEGYSYRMQLAIENYSNVYNYLDLTTNLNLATEFTEWRKVSIKYKVLSSSFTFNYTRVPESNDKLSKLLLWMDTDLAEVKAPLLEPTVMKLDMSKTGTKNYGLVISRRNTKFENRQWQNATDDWRGQLILNCGGQDTNYLNTDVQVQLLGTFKISINVLLVLKDLAWDYNKKVLNKTNLGGNRDYSKVSISKEEKKEDEKQQEEEDSGTEDFVD